MSRKPAPSAAKTSHEGDRIAKVIARAGIASRREAEKLIEAGRVLPVMPCRKAQSVRRWR